MSLYKQKNGQKLINTNFFGLKFRALYIFFILL